MSQQPDFELKGKGPDEISEELEHELWLKGYCILDLNLAGSLDAALEEVADMKLASRFAAPPVPVVEGLLGPEGSSQLAWLRAFDPEAAPTGDEVQEGASDGPTLESVTSSLVEMARCTMQFCNGAGVDIVNITPMAVVQGGDSPEDGTELTENSCSFWLSTFCHAKLMMLYFLGPGEGTLELQPLDDDSGEVRITTAPDMLVILRADSLSHRLRASSNDYTVCSWIVAPATTGPRGWNATSTEVMEKSPGVADLSQWVDDRLKLLMEQQLNETIAEDVPRTWQKVMKSVYFNNTSQPLAVRGAATHSTSTHDTEVFWKSVNLGSDLVGNIPFLRWDHAEYYDPDPNAYMASHAFRGGICKTTINHFAAIEGVTLFDNKFFQISQSEATGMEPQQRHILETSYEGLHQAGYNKKQLMNSYIAVFSGSTNPESMYIDYTTGAGAGNQSQAIISNRTSFVLGVMGPSTSIDCEMASSAMALMVGCSAVAPNHRWRHETGGHSEAAICGGVYICLTPYMWPRFNAYMNPVGRSFTFDQSANGYVRGEACTSICLKPYMEKVDGEWVEISEGSKILGTLVGWRMTNNGRGATLTAPHAPAIQENVLDAIRKASITPMDMDAVECHGVGGLLDDSVEASALAKALRAEAPSDEEPLTLGSVKTNTAAQCEHAGMAQFMKVLHNIQYACQAASNGLKQINPHMELGDTPMQFPTEALAYRDRHAFHGLSSRGLGGTNTHMVSWYTVDNNLVRTEVAAAFERQPFSFWPGGGGMLEQGAAPSDGYFIVGSWGEWEETQLMDKQDESTFSYTVTLGLNRFETFQIWIDGESTTALHPAAPKAPSGCPVEGPSDMMDVAGKHWMIDGRVMQVPGMLMDASAPEDQTAAAGALAPQVVEACTRDRGAPGDQYEVKLSIAGKYRAVSWTKVKTVEPGSAILDPLVQGKYYLTGDFNRWTLEPMTPSGDAEGRHTAKVSFRFGGRYDFKVIRNKDWEQTFYPSFSPAPSSSFEADEDVLGPDDGGAGYTTCWCILASGGDSFVVEFQRKVVEGAEVRSIAWRPAG